MGWYDPTFHHLTIPPSHHPIPHPTRVRLVTDSGWVRPTPPRPSHVLPPSRDDHPTIPPSHHPIPSHWCWFVLLECWRAAVCSLEHAHLTLEFFGAGASVQDCRLAIFTGEGDGMIPPRLDHPTSHPGMTIPPSHSHAIPHHWRADARVQSQPRRPRSRTASVSKKAWAVVEKRSKDVRFAAVIISPRRLLKFTSCCRISKQATIHDRSFDLQCFVFKIRLPSYLHCGRKQHNLCELCGIHVKNFEPSQRATWREKAGAHSTSTLRQFLHPRTNSFPGLSLCFGCC